MVTFLIILAVLIAIIIVISNLEALAGVVIVFAFFGLVFFAFSSIPSEYLEAVLLTIFFGGIIYMAIDIYRLKH